jgi:NAD-dependent SIR2 family protein deacetylase
VGVLRLKPGWVPTGRPAPITERLDEVAEVLQGGRVAVLTGAGISTESGIPDYRGANGRLRRQLPMSHDEFVTSIDGRRRYWARSHLGWRTIARAAPNDGHRAVAALRNRGHLSAVITQNVDGLHQAAGTPDVVELHGSLDWVVCLGCGERTRREELDRRLHEANAGFDAAAISVKPDGDVEIDDGAVGDFQVVDCVGCDGGVLKPDVVFFGGTVPRATVDRCYGLVDGADALLVLGSSLAVMSGLRFVRHAAKTGKPVLIINRGETRGDPYTTTRVDRPLGPALTELAARLGCPAG